MLCIVYKYLHWHDAAKTRKFSYYDDIDAQRKLSKYYLYLSIIIYYIFIFIYLSISISFGWESKAYILWLLYFTYSK